MQATHPSDFTPADPVLAVSLELSKNSWKIGLHDGRRNTPAIHTANDEQATERLRHVIRVIETTRQKWKLPAAVRIVVSYEAGQDGFWIARDLIGHGFEAVVVDPASIPVERKARRAKTDRLDVIRLVSSLRAWLGGERERMKVVRIPTPEQEDQRQLIRARGQLQKEVEQHRDRIRKLLRTVGTWQAAADFGERLAGGGVLDRTGEPLGAGLLYRLNDEWQRLTLVATQLASLEKTMQEQLPETVQKRIGTLMRLKAVGAVGATRLTLELFWRRFQNRRQVGACVGLTPQPYNSGDSRIDQGISKTGNKRVRALLIEMAWFWLRYQPASSITKWFMQRTAHDGTNRRGKRIAIVAVARRLAIALWRYLDCGVMPEGATLKTT